MKKHIRIVDYIYYGHGKCSAHGKYESVGFMGCPECFNKVVVNEAVYKEKYDTKTNKLVKV